MSIAERVRAGAFKAVSAAYASLTGVQLAEVRAYGATIGGIGLTDVRLGAFLGGGLTASGKSVTVDSALSLDTVWACVKLISETIASMPLKLYDGLGTNNAALARSHPLYPVLTVAPNADMTPMEFWGCMIGSLCLWGNGFAQIIRSTGGRVIALNPLRPDRMTVRRDLNTGELTYTYAWQGQYLTLTEDDMLHIRGWGLDGIMGISPISAGRQSLGIALAADETAGSMFRNGLLSQTYVKSPEYIPEGQETRAKQALADISGAINAGRTPLLEGGWSIETIGIKPEDLQLLETRGFNVETICRWFGVAPVMIGRMEKSTAWGSGLEQMNLWFLTYTLLPILSRIEQAISRCLLSASDRLRYYPKHNVNGLLRGDSSARAALYTSYGQNGIMTRNEMRALEELPPLPGGDVLTVQAQMIPLTDVGKAAVQPTTKPVPGGQPSNAAAAAGDDEDDDA